MKFKCHIILPFLVASLHAASVDDLTFTLINGDTEYSVTSCESSASGSLEIPSIYNNLPVTRIGSDAFAWKGVTLTSVTIPGTVTYIGYYAFNGIATLEHIAIKATIAPALSEWSDNPYEDEYQFEGTPASYIAVPVGSSGYNRNYGSKPTVEVAFPYDPNLTVDTDGDGVADNVDAFPGDATETIDTDGDLIGNNTDTDDDGDGVADVIDNAPLVVNLDQSDTDGDGEGDVIDTDDDGDGVADDADNAPLVVNADQLDTDGDGLGDVIDNDDDGDGANDEFDEFPLDPNETSDSDGDGIGDNRDAFPMDPSKASLDFGDINSGGFFYEKKGTLDFGYMFDEYGGGSPSHLKLANSGDKLFVFRNYTDYNYESGSSSINPSIEFYLLDNIWSKNKTFINSPGYTIIGASASNDGNTIILKESNGESGVKVTIHILNNNTWISLCDPIYLQNISNLTISGDKKLLSFMDENSNIFIKEATNYGWIDKLSNASVINDIDNINDMTWSNDMQMLSVKVPYKRYLFRITDENLIIQLKEFDTSYMVWDNYAHYNIVTGEQYGDFVIGDTTHFEFYNDSGSFFSIRENYKCVVNDEVVDVDLGFLDGAEFDVINGFIIATYDHKKRVFRKDSNNSIFYQIGQDINLNNSVSEIFFDKLGNNFAYVEDQTMKYYTLLNGIWHFKPLISNSNSRGIIFNYDLNSYVKIINVELDYEINPDGMLTRYEVYSKNTDPLLLTDNDNDGFPNWLDTFPDNLSEWLDTDDDGVGDNSDLWPNDPLESADSDGDGVGDNADAFPTDPNETADSDGDGVGDNSDAFPSDPAESADSDSDGVGDNADIDDDNDGIADSYDPSPLSYDSSTNVPASLKGYVEIAFVDNSPTYFIWYGATENDSINILYDENTEYRFQDNYLWNSEDLTSTGYSDADGQSTGYNGGGTFRTNFKNKTNDLFFRFTFVSESSEIYADNSGKGFFYDGRIDLDNNGMADGEQIADGLPFPATDSIINLANIYDSAESNLIPIQVLDYVSNEKYLPSELKDLRAGSTMIEVQNGQANLLMEIEQSDDLEV